MRSREGKLELKKVGTHFNPSDVLTNVCSSISPRSTPSSSQYLQGQFSKGQKQFILGSKTSSIFNRINPPSATLNIIDHDDAVVSLHVLCQLLIIKKHLRQRLSQASRSFKTILTPPRRGSGDQGDSSVHSSSSMPCIMIQKFESIRERE